jgi:cytochrome c oxidase subunit 2
MVLDVNIPPAITTLLAGILLTLVSLWYGQNHGLLPTAASEEASSIDGLFNTMMTISTGLYLIVVGALVISAFRFRRRPGDDTDGPPVHGNVPLEILWTAIPAITVLGLAIYSFDVYNNMGGFNPLDHSVAHAKSTQQMVNLPGAAIAATLDSPPQAITEGQTRNQELQEQATQDAATDSVQKDLLQLQDAPTQGVVSPRIGPTPERAGKPPQLSVNVTGLQFAWIFTYPDTGIVASELHVPIGREVFLDMTANDVIHAFWVPEFRLKQDVIPGRQTELRFTPNREGEYPLICAELCGPYHGAMKTKVIVQTPSEFDNWIAEQKIASSQESSQTLAMAPAQKTPAQFLAPVISDLGITAETLQSLQPAPHLHHS